MSALESTVEAGKDNAEEADEVCANCGTAALDDVKLKKCACKLVRYCSVDCQKNHRSHHKKACKKRLAEIREDLLFRQPESSHLGDCPICCLPLPIDHQSNVASKEICAGCFYANYLREKEGGLEHKCPYCREPIVKTEEATNQQFMKRAKANDPIAFLHLGTNCHREGDFEGAFNYYTKAAASGNMEAHYQLSFMYSDGEGVERDPKKEINHLEEAAIGGHPGARYNLGCHEGDAGKYDRAMKHLIIAAKLGFDEGLEGVKEGFMDGLVSKEDYAAALRGHQAAVDATKSEHRDAAYKYQ
jgi:TPR repeat protein